MARIVVGHAELEPGMHSLTFREHRLDPPGTQLGASIDERGRGFGQGSGWRKLLHAMTRHAPKLLHAAVERIDRRGTDVRMALTTGEECLERVAVVARKPVVRHVVARFARQA